MGKIIAFICFSMTLLCCKKEHVAPPSKSCLDFVFTDSENVLNGFQHQHIYFFNSDNKLYQKLSTDFIVIGHDTTINDRYVDSFAYSNGNMVKTWFSISGDISHPYTTSEFDYSGSLLVASRYYLGTSLIVHSVYTNDSLGRISSITQYSDNDIYNYTSTNRSYLNYDANSNLQTVVNDAGKVIYSFKNYDNRPNPFYKLPFDWAYNIFDSFTKYLSKNNQLSSNDNGDENYLDSYDYKGRIVKSIYSWPLGTIRDFVKITYKCD